MNPTDFHTALLQPEQLGAAQVADLRALVEAHPWCASAHVMLAKALHSSASPSYDDQLHLAAVHVGSRRVIYDLVVAKEIAAGKVDLPVVETTSETEENQAHLEISPQKNTLQDERPLETVEPPLVQEQPTVQEPATEEQAEPEQVEVAQVAHVVPPETPPNTHPVESPLEEAVETPEVVLPIDLPEAPLEEVASISDDVERLEQPIEGLSEAAPEQESPAKRPLDELERTIITASVSRVIEHEVSQGSGGDETAPEEALEVAPIRQQAKEDEALSPFANWLLKRSTELGYQVEAPVTQQDASMSGQEPQEDPKAKQQRLIDSFIQKDPHITRGRVSDFDAGDLAQHSLASDDSLVTETMARIYAHQGKVSKARKAYQMLALKYPEKSIYFANQLKKLEKKK